MSGLMPAPPLSTRATATGPKPDSRVLQYQQVAALLPPPARQELATLAREGLLTQSPASGLQPTPLDSLAKMATTARAPGLSPSQTLAETVHLLAHPNDVRQPFTPTDATTWQALLQLNQSPLAPDSPRPWQPNEMKVQAAHTCAAAAELSRLATQHPDQLARLAEEITRPALTATSTVTPQALGVNEEVAKGVDNASQVAQRLQALNLTGQPVDPTHWQVNLPAPAAGLIRAVNAQRHPGPYTSRGVEVLLQSALMALATRQTYNPAVDRREQIATLTSALLASPELPDAVKAAWQQTLTTTAHPWRTTAQFQQWLDRQAGLSEAERTRLKTASEATDVGLHESEEALMQAVLEPDTTWRSVTCQVTMRDPAQPGQLLLAGYTQPFERTTADLLETLLRGQEVIVGLTLPDGKARIQGGHIIKVAGYSVDPVSQRLSFLVADSDDTEVKLVPRQAADLVPLIHHLTLPGDLAAADWERIRANGRAFYHSGPGDRVWFHPTPLTASPFPHDLLLPGETPESFQALNASFPECSV